jgi:hypothetical protein
LGVKEENILTLKLKLTLFFFLALVSQRGLCGSEV